MHGSLMLDIAGTWLTAEDRHLLRQPEVGGLILFARNIECPRQVEELCCAIRAVRPDLLLAVDQEGGRVQRLKAPWTVWPPMRALGRIGSGVYDVVSFPIEVPANYASWYQPATIFAPGNWTPPRSASPPP